MKNNDQKRAAAKRTLRKIIELLDAEIERMHAEAAQTTPLPDPARRSLQRHELN